MDAQGSPFYWWLKKDSKAILSFSTFWKDQELQSGTRLPSVSQALRGSVRRICSFEHAPNQPIGTALPETDSSIRNKVSKPRSQVAGSFSLIGDIQWREHLLSIGERGIVNGVNTFFEKLQSEVRRRTQKNKLETFWFAENRTADAPLFVVLLWGKKCYNY